MVLDMPNSVISNRLGGQEDLKVWDHMSDSPTQHSEGIDLHLGPLSVQSCFPTATNGGLLP